MSADKNLSLNIGSTYNYIRIFNGLMELTDTEARILAEFIDVKMSLEKAGMEDISPFSTDMKKRVANNLGRDDFNTLNNYIKNFSDKGAIKKIDGRYYINPILVPTGNNELIQISVTFDE